MTFIWIENQGLPRRTFGELCFERRIDDRTACNVADALRARGVQAAALAMDHLRVDMDVALRVLAWAAARRNAHLAGSLPDPRQTVTARATHDAPRDDALAGS